MEPTTKLIKNSHALVAGKLTESSLIPKRKDMIEKLQKEEFDILIIGGGATGSGAALDAARRGLKVACIEREDFASGTSSRSTKLLWGGSRYLVQAFVSLFNFDLRLIRSPSTTIQNFVKEFKMVLNCHRERSFMLEHQPHLTHWVPIAVPLKNWLILPPPFNYPPAALGPLGLFPLFFKFYDALSGFSCPPSHIMSPARAKRKFPQLAIEEIIYCPVFYEGMHDDARTNLAIAQTAAKEGANIVNYMEAKAFLFEDEKNKSGKVIGAVMVDKMSGKEFKVYAKSVLLCGGPFTDDLRKMEDPKSKESVTGASGIHIVLPSYFAPSGFGLVDMNTSDGRFLFFLPWNDHVLVGTTDHKCKPTMRPVPDEAEIKWLLNEASKYLSPELKLRRKDVLSAWSGIRPLATDPHSTDTASTSRDHIISYNPDSGVVFVSGGKWTTFREMAEDALNKVLDTNPIVSSRASKACSTLESRLVGFEGYTPNLEIRLIQDYDISLSVAKRLAKAYGGRAREVLDIAREMSSGDKDLYEKLVIPGHPYLEAEVVFSVRHDWACHAEDFIARRSRLAFLNKGAALAAIPRVVEIMAKELHWDTAQQKEEVRRCIEFMRHMGGTSPIHGAKVSVRMATVADIRDSFRKIDVKHSGVLNKEEVRFLGEMLNYQLSEEEINDCLDYASSLNIPAGKVSFEAVSSWWNSDRKNQGLVHLKQNNMASADQIEGSGTVFG